MTHRTRLPIRITDPDQRLDLALLEALRARHPGISRAMLKEWFKQDRVCHRERPVSPSHLLGEGLHEIDLVGIDPESATDLSARASASGCFLPVIYEDEDLLVLNKRSGIPSVPHSREETETAVGAALARVPALSEVGRGGYEPGILHRLDTGTSGLLVFARHQAEFDRLREDWRARRVKKIYRAVVRPPLGNDDSTPVPPPILKEPLPLTLDFPLGHDAKSDKRMIALPSRDPRANALATSLGRENLIRGSALPSLTRILELREIRTGLLDATVEIETGVMHQIRAHLATLGLPLQGDPVYRGTPSSRLWLHAWRLELTTRSGTLLALEAQLPANWPGMPFSP